MVDFITPALDIVKMFFSLNLTDVVAGGIAVYGISWLADKIRDTLAAKK